MPAQSTRKALTLTCSQCGNSFERLACNVRCEVNFCSHDCYSEALRARSLATLATRFWAKVDRRGPDECWPWMGVRIKGDYGLFSARGRRVRAPRMAYELVHGPLPADLEVLHSCDNPPCVNPAHLSADSHKQNMEEAGERLLMRHGEAHPDAKLTVIEVIAARQTYAAGGVSIRALSDSYGVDYRTMRALLRRETWKSVA